MTVKIVIILFIHLFGDFLLQGSSMSKFKMSKMSYLFLHVLIYTAFLFVMSYLFLSLTIQQNLLFCGINGGLHLLIDFITSMIKKRLWGKNESLFIAVISLDTLLHIGILVYTYFVFFSESALKGTGL